MACLKRLFDVIIVKEFGIPSFLKGKELEKKGRDINSLGPDYAAHGGAYPIRIEVSRIL